MTGISRRLLATGSAAALLPMRARAQAARTVRIGVLSDLTGPYRDATGPTSVACAQQAVQEFGMRGFNVEVISGDHQNKPDVGVTLARRWFDVDGVDLILDVPNSAVALAVNTLAKERNKAYVNCGGTTADLTGKDCTPNTVHWAYDSTMLSSAVGSEVTKAGGKKWFFITVDQAGGHQFQDETTLVVGKFGGSVVGAAVYPFGTTDFSSYLAQAKVSGADVVGLANAGDDTVNCVKQAHEFGLKDGGQRLAAIFGSVTVAHGIGLDTAQGLLMAESFYWDLNDRTRSFAKRVLPRTPNNMPNAIHAACYAGTLHYLKAVADLGPDAAKDGAAVIARMKAVPADDDCFGRTVIRADGRAMVTPYLLQVKDPAKSRSEWDVFNVLSAADPETTAAPLSACPLVKA